MTKPAPIVTRAEADDAVVSLIATLQAVRTHLRGKSVNWGHVRGLASVASSGASDFYFLICPAADEQADRELAKLRAAAARKS